MKNNIFNKKKFTVVYIIFIILLMIYILFFSVYIHEIWHYIVWNYIFWADWSITIKEINLKEIFDFNKQLSTLWYYSYDSKNISLIAEIVMAFSGVFFEIVILLIIYYLANIFFLRKFNIDLQNELWLFFILLSFSLIYYNFFPQEINNDGTIIIKNLNLLFSK